MKSYRALSANALHPGTSARRLLRTRSDLSYHAPSDATALDYVTENYRALSANVLAPGTAARRLIKVRSDFSNSAPSDATAVEFTTESKRALFADEMSPEIAARRLFKARSDLSNRAPSDASAVEYGMLQTRSVDCERHDTVGNAADRERGGGVGREEKDGETRPPSGGSKPRLEGNGLPSSSTRPLAAGGPFHDRLSRCSHMDTAAPCTRLLPVTDGTEQESLSSGGRVGSPRKLLLHPTGGDGCVSRAASLNSTQLVQLTRSAVLSDPFRGPFVALHIV